MKKSISTYELLNMAFRFIFYSWLLDNNPISTQMLVNIFLPDFESDKDKNKKNIAKNSSHSH